VLCALRDAGVPTHDPDEESHLLTREPLPVVRLGNTDPTVLPPKWCVTTPGKREVIGFFHDEAAARWFAERWETQ